MTEHTIHKELGALRILFKGTKRAGHWYGDVARVMPVRFSPEYRPRDRGLSFDEVRRVMGELEPERAAWVALAVGAGAERAALERAERGDHDATNIW